MLILNSFEFLESKYYFDDVNSEEISQEKHLINLFYVKFFDKAGQFVAFKIKIMTSKINEFLSNIQFTK